MYAYLISTYTNMPYESFLKNNLESSLPHTTQTGPLTKKSLCMCYSLRTAFHIPTNISAKQRQFYL